MNNKTIKQNKLIILFILFKIILDFLYYAIISVKWAYYGFIGGFSIGWHIVSWCIFFITMKPVIKMLKNSHFKFSTMMIYFLLLLSYIPFLSMLAANYDWVYKISNIVFWSILVFVVYKFQKPYKQQTEVLNRSCKILDLLTIFNVIIVLFVVAYYSHFRFSLDLSNVYDTRSEASEYGMPTVLSYLFNWSRIIIPVSIVYYFNNKKYRNYLFLIVIQIFSFSFDGLKFVALITLAAAILPVILKLVKVKERFYRFMLLAMVIVCVFSVVEYVVLSKTLITSLIPFRTLFLPNLIGSWFFDFFKTNTPDFYRASFLRYLGFESQFSKIGIDYIISGVYFGNIEGRANNGLIADAMTNFGYSGIIFFPLIMSALILIGDKITRKVDFDIVLLLAINYSYCFTNTFLPVILMTYGGIAVFFILNLITKKKHIRKNNFLIHSPCN